MRARAHGTNTLAQRKAVRILYNYTSIVVGIQQNTTLVFNLFWFTVYFTFTVGFEMNISCLFVFTSDFQYIARNSIKFQ